LKVVRSKAEAIFCRYPGVRKAYLFGSVLRPGAMRFDSDLDIAIEGDLKAGEYFALWRDLEDALEGWPVELVILDENVPFAKRVIETGELLYERTDTDAESGHSSRS